MTNTKGHVDAGEPAEKLTTGCHNQGLQSLMWQLLYCNVLNSNGKAFESQDISLLLLYAWYYVNVCIFRKGGETHDYGWQVTS